jgi:hypothetical protein
LGVVKKVPPILFFDDRLSQSATAWNSERRYGIGKGSWVSTKPSHDEDDAFMAFVAEPATTVQGLFAKLAYFDELAGEFETEWMVRERAEAAVLIQSFAASIRSILVLP